MDHAAYTSATDTIMGVCSEPTQLLLGQKQLSNRLRTSLKLLYDGATVSYALRDSS
jgi:hypothetical protein